LHLSYHIISISISCKQFRQHLKGLEQPNQPGVYDVPYENGKTEHLVALRKGFGSKSESYRRKNEIDAAYSIQADSGIPIDAFVQHLNRKDKKDACIDKLKISGRLGVKDSLDFQTTLNLTNAQMQDIQQAGLDISPQKEITELKRVKELEHKLEKKELLINKKRDREQVTMKQGNMYAMREVFTTDLEEAAIRLIGCTDKQAKWDHIPQNHNPLTPEDRKKVVIFQEMKSQMARLKEKRKTADPRLTARIDEIIIKRSLEIEELGKELNEIEDGNGQVFLLLSADHGETLKLFLQNLTTEKPNSAANDYVVGEMDAPEKYENLKAAFGHYQKD